MADVTPTFKGWYPDSETGGTRYWDGSRWTGDVRPKRRSFAAPGHEDGGIPIALIGLAFLVMSFFASELNDGSVPTFGLFTVFFLMGVASIAGGIYMYRGQGPTTQAVERRLAEEEKQAKVRRRSANIAGTVSAFTRSRLAPPAVPARQDADAHAAQVAAISNPETARALQTLQSLLYTRALTDEEFRAAKDKLLGSVDVVDPYEQVAKLAELHRAGVLGDVEFSAAKARVLGL